MKITNLKNNEDRKEVKIGASLKDAEKGNLIELLHDYVGVFAGSYKDMPKLGKDIVVHKLPLKEECLPVKQKLRRTRSDMAFKIREDVRK